MGASAMAMVLSAGSGLAGTIPLASGTSGTMLGGQSFNETRAADVTVLPGPNVSVVAMTLDGLSIASATSVFVGARIYDSSTTSLVASGSVTITSGGSVTVPISATLLPGTTYRVGFYVETTPPNQGSGTLFDPGASGPGGTPYTEATGQLQVDSFHAFPADSFPTFVNFGIPLITLQTSTGSQACFPGTGGVTACPCGQPANPTGGCANFGAGSTTGAVLSAGGIADLSDDMTAATLFLATTNHRSPPQGILNVFFSYKPGSSTPSTGIPSGAGVRCIGTGGNLKRLYTTQVRGGMAAEPGAGDPSISQVSSGPGHAIAPPETRHYFNVYRDGQASAPANCNNPLVSTNLTNMASVLWVP